MSPTPLFRRILAVLLLAGLVLPGTVAPAPAEAASGRPARIVSGWLPDWAMRANLDTVRANSDLFHTAMPFWYDLQADGTIRKRPGAGDRAVVDALRARRVKVVPTITGPIGPITFNRLMRDPATRASHVRRVVRLVRDNGYDGIDINYEHFAVSKDATLSARNRDLFSSFVDELCSALRKENKLCSIVVMARTNDRMQAGYRPELAVGVYDYAAIGAAADQVRVMVYDHHHPMGRPGPIAGYEWSEQVIRYAVDRIPSRKVHMGFPTYGRDWGRTGVRAEAFTTRQAVQRARANGATIRWDATHREHTFTYTRNGVRHTAYYGDHRSLRARLGLARRYELGGIALWTPAGGDARVYDELRSYLTTNRW